MIHKITKILIFVRYKHVFMRVLLWHVDIRIPHALTFHQYKIKYACKAYFILYWSFLSFILYFTYEVSKT